VQDPAVPGRFLFAAIRAFLGDLRSMLRLPRAKIEKQGNYNNARLPAHLVRLVTDCIGRAATKRYKTMTSITKVKALDCGELRRWLPIHCDSGSTLLNQGGPRKASDGSRTHRRRPCRSHRKVLRLSVANSRNPGWSPLSECPVNASRCPWNGHFSSTSPL
jgi:hypothetical protein